MTPRDKPSGVPTHAQIEEGVRHVRGELELAGAKESTRQALEALHQSESRYRRLFEAAKDGILILDAQTGMVVDVNPFLIELLGYPREQFLEKKVWELGFFKDVFANEAKFAELQRKGYVRYEDLPLETADGRRANVEFVSNVYEVNHHKVIQCNIRDITERRRAEDALRHSEGKYRRLHESMTDAYVQVDMSGRILEHNRAYREMLGYTDEELHGLTYPDITQLQWREMESRLVQEQILPRGYSDVYEKEYVRKDGTVFPVELRTFLVPDPDGRPAGMWAIVRDITERKRAQAAAAAHATALEVLSESVSHFLEIGSTDGLFEYAARQLSAAAGSAVVVVTECRPAEKDVVVRAVAGPEEKLQRLSVLLGRDPVGGVLTVNEAAMGRFPKGPLAQVAGGLHVATFGHLSLETSRQIEESLRVGEVYAMSFARGDDLMGTAVILTDRAEGLLNREILEPLVIQAGLALKRGRAEEALRASEQEFHTLAESVPQIVWTTGPDGRNLYFNQRWVDYTGLALEESHGHGWNKPFHPDDRQRAWDAWQDATRNDADYSLECRLRRADGAYRWWLVRGSPLRDSSGRILKWFGTCTDIEDIKQAEAALKESEEKFRNLFNNAEVGMFRTRLNGSEFLEANDRYLSILGRTREEVVGKPTLVLWADPREREEMVRILKSKGRVDDFECRLFNKAGDVVYCLTSLRAYPRNGVLEGSILDITQRKRAEESLRASEERYRKLVDNIHLGISLIGPDYRILATNVAQAELSQISEVEMVGQPCHRVFRHRDQVCENCPGARAMATGKAQEDTHEGQRGDGSPLCGESAGLPPDRARRPAPGVHRGRRGRHRPRPPGGAVAPSGQDAGHRATGRGRRPRLPQPTHRHQGLRRDAAPAGLDPGEGQGHDGRSPQGRRPVGNPDRTVAGVQPQRGA